MRKSVKLCALCCFLVVMAIVPSSSKVPGVSYTVTGSSGNWTLDFSVTNNLPSALNQLGIYFFGVELDARDIVGTPAGYDPDVWTTWDNTPYGGSSIVYNNNWLGVSASGGIPQGSTLSGFQVHSISSAMPSSVPWFAWAYGIGSDYYTGGDPYLFSLNNPGFEGTATPVPEPGLLQLPCLVGLLGFGRWFVRRRAA
jgi:hypothetical protein